MEFNAKEIKDDKGIQGETPKNYDEQFSSTLAFQEDPLSTSLKLQMNTDFIQSPSSLTCSFLLRRVWQSHRNNSMLSRSKMDIRVHFSSVTWTKSPRTSFATKIIFN